LRNVSKKNKKKSCKVTFQEEKSRFQEEKEKESARAEPVAEHISLGVGVRGVRLD
jgi:hypothetical protein